MTLKNSSLVANMAPRVRPHNGLHLRGSSNNENIFLKLHGNRPAMKGAAHDVDLAHESREIFLPILQTFPAECIPNQLGKFLIVKHSSTATDELHSDRSFREEELNGSRLAVARRVVR